MKIISQIKTNTTPLKVAGHCFGSLWAYVIYQIKARERLQLTSWNLASKNPQVKNILMKYFDWQVKFDVFVVSMATWTIEYNIKISLSLIRVSYKLAHILLQLIITIWNLFDQILTDGFLDNQ